MAEVPRSARSVVVTATAEELGGIELNSYEEIMEGVEGVTMPEPEGGE